MTMVFDVLPAMLAAGTALSAAASTGAAALGTTAGIASMTAGFTGAAAAATTAAATASTGLFGAGILTAGNVFAGISAATTLYKAVDMFSGADEQDPMERLYKAQAGTKRNLPGEANLRRIKTMKASRLKTTSENGGLLSTNNVAGGNTQKLGSG